MKITKFDRKVCESLSAEVAAALQEIAAKYGLSVERAGGKFGDAEYTTHMKFTVLDASAKEAAERKEWDANCRYFDLEPSHFGATFVTAGKAYSAFGFTSRAKFPLKAREVATGKVMMFSDLAIAQISSKRSALAGG